MFDIFEGRPPVYKELAIQYGHHRQRIRQQYTAAGSTTTKVYVGASEYITTNGQTTTHTYLSGPEGLFALHVKNPNGSENIRYIQKDHLGSWNTISDENGNLLQELSFDAWGNRRNPATWRAFASTPPQPLFDRGFTGHEHLYGFQLINMNGRMYDPVVSRMLSPDNFVQAPDFSQSFNRYSYVMNNPVNLIDLSGYTWQDYEDIPPDVDDELRAILEQSGYTFDEVVVTATHLNPMEEIWKMHDGFEFDREYDGYDAENNRAANGGDDVNPASAYWHYKFGEKADYHVDISQVNWSMLSAKDFPDGVGSIRQINIFNIKPFSTAGIVFGDIRLQYLGNNQIKDADVFGSGPLAGKPYFDTYNYNVRWGEVMDGQNLKRNIITGFGWICVNLPWHPLLFNTYGGDPYKFIFHGTGTIGGGQ